jgi:hypothetical protein
MVQTNLGLMPIDYEIIDAVPTQQKTKKQVPVPTSKGEFEERWFIRIPVRGADRLRRGDSELEKWCYDHYKEPRYLGPWFKISGYIILDELTYTHWKLCE